MKIITKFMLALTVVGSLAFTSCKDYDSDNYNNALIKSNQTLKDALAEQKTALETEIQSLQKQLNAVKSCDCTVGTEDAVNALINKKLAGYALQTAIDDLQKQVDAINNAGYQTAAQVTTLIEGNKTITDAVENIKTAQTDITNLKKDVADKADKTALETAKTELNTSITNIKNAEADLSSRIDKIYKDSIAPMYSWYKSVENELVTKSALTDYYTAKQIDSIKEKYVTLEKFGQDLAALGKADSAYTDAQIKLVNTRIDSTNANVANLQTAMEKADSAMKYRIDSLCTVVTNLNTKVDSLANELSDLRADFQSLANKVTGIIVQQVWNPAFGTYSSVLTNAQTNMLVAYVGTGDAVTFPNTALYPEASAETINLSDVDAVAGKVYLTVNPNTVDFTGLTCTLVNSQDQECAIKLGELNPSDKALNLGLTRSANNGFYEATATLEAGTLDQHPELKINLDKSKISTAIKNLMDVNSKSDTKTSVKEIASVAYQAAVALSDLQAFGVKCAYKDSLGEHAVYSNYNMAAVAFKPLSIKAMENYDVDSYFDKAHNLIKRVADKIYNKYGSKLAARGIRNIDYSGEQVLVTVNYKDQDGNVVQSLVDALTGVGAVFSNDGCTAVVTMSITDSNGIITALAANDVQTLTKMANDILDEINSSEESLAGNNLLNKIYDYLDKVNAKFKNFLKPTVFLNASDRLAVAGIYGAPSFVKAGEITLIPTTYSLELAAPIYMKYVRVTNTTTGAVVYSNKYQDIKQIKLNVEAGNSYKVEYSVLDYCGNVVNKYGDTAYYITAE